MLASSRGTAGLTRPVVLGSSEMRAVEAAVETLPDKVTIRERAEYFAARTVLAFLGWLPHRLARAFAGLLAALCYFVWPRLRRVGLFNLRLAFPQWNDRQRRKTLFGLFQNFGRMLADFAQFPRFHRSNIERRIIYDG